MTTIIGVCVKWIGSQPSSGHEADARFAQFSASDQAALETALQRAEQLSARVRVVSVAPAAARTHLVALCATGVHELVHIAAEGQSSSAHIAHELAQHLQDCASVWCGDYSLDRGSGSVPAFIASTLGAQQALGIVGITPSTSNNSLELLRRLDAGRREIVRVLEPFVVSVEGSLATLRRASLASTLRPTATVIDASLVSQSSPSFGEFSPFRPRPRTIAAPVGETALDRIKSATSANSPQKHSEIVTLAPEAAAQCIVERLTEWGYLS
jgi:electron transfer flavoprotein beta subunit